MLKKLNFKKRNIIIAVIVILLAVLIFYIFFAKNNYKIFETGNTMSNKNIEEIEQYILNINSYEAKIEVTVESNKNTNKYVLLQQYVSPNQYKQTVLEPSNIEGTEIVYDGQNLKVSNSKLNVSKLYENYAYAVSNVLCLESFIADYQESKNMNANKLYEENEEYVMEAEIKEGNVYTKNEKLYISKSTGKPTRLLIEDVNEKTLVYILYNEIKINE